MKKLIVNADDFGRSPGINRGILDAHLNGIVTSTTVMINYPDAAPGLEQALLKAPDLGIGLHLNLTSGRPVSAPGSVASLVDENGFFHHISQWPTRFDTFETDHIQREIAAQVDRFASLVGHPPDHLDSHHHATYLHPVALQAMLEIAAGYGIPMRNGYSNAHEEDAALHLSRIVPGFDEAFARPLFEQLTRIIASGPSPCWPARFEMGFYDATATLADLLIIVTNLPDDSITEIMCHPGYIDEILGTSGYLAPREREVEVLTHPATRECVQAEGIHLTSFRDLRC